MSAVTPTHLYLPLHRANQKRFQRIESHIITLARSVAHISSEMRSHSSLFVEVDRLAKELDNIKQVIKTASDKLKVNMHVVQLTLALPLMHLNYDLTTLYTTIIDSFRAL